MQNLAGHPDPDPFLIEELLSVGIEPIKGEKSDREVSTRITGRLGPFEFVRAWYYWTVKGPMPIAGAWEMYENPIGRETVRVEGNCGCPAPEGNFVTYLDAEGREIALLSPADQKLRVLAKEGKLDPLLTEVFRGMEAKNAIVNTEYELNRLTVRRVVNTYHIDTPAGLRLFADTARKYVKTG